MAIKDVKKGCWWETNGVNYRVWTLKIIQVDETFLSQVINGDKRAFGSNYKAIDWRFARRYVAKLY